MDEAPDSKLFIFTAKNCAFFALKLFLIGVLFQPLLVLTLIIVIIGAIRLFYFGESVTVEKELKDLSLLKKGDIILTGKKSVGYWWYIQISNVLTRKLKHRFWTHAALYAGEGLVWEAQPGGKGIVKTDLKKYLDDGFVLRAFRHKYIRDENVLNEVIRFCSEKENGYSYGWVGLCFYTFSSFMPISFNWLYNDPIIDRLCRLDKAGHALAPYDGWRVKPSDFISNPLLEPVVSPLPVAIGPVPS